MKSKPSPITIPVEFADLSARPSSFTVPILHGVALSDPLRPQGARPQLARHIRFAAPRAAATAPQL